MSNEESRAYMKNVRWTTAGIVFSSTLSTLIAIVWFAAGIKADIKDNRVIAHEENQATESRLNKKIDDLTNYCELQFQSISILQKEVKSTKTKVIYKSTPAGYFTEHKDPVTGLITFKAVQ